MRWCMWKAQISELKVAVNWNSQEHFSNTQKFWLKKSWVALTSALLMSINLHLCGTVLGINNSHVNSSQHSYSQKENSSNNHYSHIPTVSDLWCTKGSVLDSRIFIIKVNSVLNFYLESWKQSTVYNSVIVESQSKSRLIIGTLVAKFSVPSHVVLFTKNLTQVQRKLDWLIVPGWLDKYCFISLQNPLELLLTFSPILPILKEVHNTNHHQCTLYVNQILLHPFLSS